MTTATYKGRSIICVCGERVNTDLEEEIGDGLGIDDSVEDSEDYECDNCGRMYRLTISAWITVETEFQSLVQIGEPVTDSDGNVAELSDDRIGEHVELNDGEYQVDDRTYVVRDRVLVDAWTSRIDELQIKLAI